MSHVAMAKKICDVCGVVHEFNTEILIHKQLKDIDPDKTITGYGLCEEHQKLFDEGYIALVAANVLASEVKNGIVKREDTQPTGELAHVRRTVFNKMFDTQVDDGLPLVYVEPEVIKMLTQQLSGE